MDPMTALRLLVEWGADEALQPDPVDRLVALAAAAAPAPAPAPAAPASAAPVAREDMPARARRLAEAAGSPEAVRDALAAADPFGLAATATSMVFASGNPAAGLVVVAEAPGAEEDASGIAFSGPAGGLLLRMLASVGLDPSQALLTMLVPWRPPGGRAPNDAEVALCHPFLLRHLALLRPRRLVTLGALPARTLLARRDAIGRLRGRWHEVAIAGLPEAVPLLPMLAPAHVLARPEQKAMAWADWRLLRRTCEQDDRFVNIQRRINV